MRAPSQIRRHLVAALAAAPLAACASRDDARGTTEFTADHLAQAMARRPLVLLGEVHDNPVQHRVRAEALDLFLQDGTRPALAFEQFDRDQQATIDQLRREAGRSGTDSASQLADRLIKQAGRGGWNWPLYRPFVELALRFDLPIVAANLSRADAMKVGRAADFDALFDRDTQRRLGLDQLPADFLQHHERVVDDGHCNTMPPNLLPALARAQIARDATLLASIRPHTERGVVLLTGNGHARNDLGVPFMMNAQERAQTVSIGLLEVPPADQSSDDFPSGLQWKFDVAFVTPRHERPDPCEPLRRHGRR